MQKLRLTLLLPLLATFLLSSLSMQLFAAEEQIFIEDLTPSQLRREIKKIEGEFYRVFNDSLEDKNLAISCYDQTPTGTNIKQEVCEPQFVVDKRGDNTNANRFGNDVLLTPEALQQSLAPEYEALTAAMNKLLGENQYFKELNSILAALRDEQKNR